jgi:predicted nucleic acid-binding protein
LLVALLQLRNGCVVILFPKSNSPRQFVDLLYPQRILGCLGTVAEFLGMRSCRAVVFLPGRQASQVVVVQERRIVLDLLRETRALDQLKGRYELTVPAGRLAGSLNNKYARRGRTLTLADAIIAAIAIERRCTLMTDNRKDFPMPELDCYDLPEP